MLNETTLSAVYPQALKRISEGFICKEWDAYIEPGSDHPFDNTSPFAVYDKTIYGVNEETIIYSIRYLAPVQIDIQPDFRNFIERDFVLKIANIYSVNPGVDSIKYLTMLFQNFVHDGDFIPTSVNHIIINDNPKQISSETIAQEYKKESVLYTHPTSIFQKQYENWNVNRGTVTLSGVRYRQASQSELNLDSVLKQQHLTPLLRYLIKLWIIHQLISVFDKNALEENEFFGIENLAEKLEELQKNIHSKINALLDLSIEERLQKAQETSENRFLLSPLLFNLSQRISFLRLIVGHSTYDIHHCSNTNLNLFSRAMFYLKSYSNFSLNKFLLMMIAKDFTKSKSAVKNFIYGNENVSSLFKPFLRLLKSLYLILWFPFFAAYFATIGLTSIPFSLVRKGLKISFGGWIDKMITTVETVKDITLALLGSPLAFSLFTEIGAACLGTVGLSLGASFAFYFGILVVSPILLISLPDSYDTYPRWVRIHGVRIYEIDSDYNRLIDFVKMLSLFRIVSIHALVAGLAFIAFTGVSVCGFFAVKVKQLFRHKQFKPTELRSQLQNLNHSPAFKQLIKSLAQKLETTSCDNDDNKMMSMLFQCKLGDKEKLLLKSYLLEGLKDDSIPEKNTYRLALQHIDRDHYLPSWKLIDRLKNEFTEYQVEPQLKASVDQIHQVYSEHLRMHV